VQRDEQLGHLGPLWLDLGPVVEELLERFDHAQPLVRGGEVRGWLAAETALAGEAP
jgi:hypothetical protein